MSTVSPRLVYPGAIVHVDCFPFEEDPTQGKSRYALVIAHRRSEVIVRGIYTQPRPNRQPITATRSSGLRHDSYLDSRLVEIPAHRINGYRGEVPLDYDPFDDFGEQ